MQQDSLCDQKLQISLGLGLRATWPWLQSTMDGLALDQGPIVNRDPRDVYWYYGYALSKYGYKKGLKLECVTCWLFCMIEKV